MTRLCVAPIVEGHGEDASVPILLRRLCMELLAAQCPDVLRPIRIHRHKIVRKDELERAIQLALSKFQTTSSDDAVRLVLVLLDADEDAPCLLGPQLLQAARESRSDVDVACVVANVEYETWFVAAAESLSPDYLDLAGTIVPAEPERARSAKAWIRRRFRGTRYSETQDQPKMTAKMNLGLCRRRSPSFDKLCRELERRLSPPTAD